MTGLAQFLSMMISIASPQTPAVPDLQGVYQSVPDGTTLPGGLKNAGSAAANRRTSNDHTSPPATGCELPNAVTKRRRVGSKWGLQGLRLGKWSGFEQPATQRKQQKARERANRSH